jgi:SAM-dependent methyltransferase
MRSSTNLLMRQMKALADPARLRLVALCRNGECGVSELVEITAMSQPRISQHLKQLCEAGLLERFRDGKRMFYRVPRVPERRTELEPLLDLIPEDDPQLIADRERLHRGRGDQLEHGAGQRDDDASRRALHRAILDLTVTTPVGDLLDIGCGRGAILKLLARRANRAVGVDIDANARQIARAELLLAGIPDCSLRQGDMYRLPFDDQEFNTIIVDDVLADARDPVRALTEARRLLRPGGRLFILESVVTRRPADIQARLAEWSAEADLRLAPARVVPARNPDWLVSVATTISQCHEAA